MFSRKTALCLELAVLIVVGPDFYANCAIYCDIVSGPADSLEPPWINPSVTKLKLHTRVVESFSVHFLVEINENAQ